MKIQAWKGASVFLPQTFVVCVFFIFPIGQFCVVLCTCPLLFLPCGFFVFQPLISLFLPLLSFYFLSHSLPRLPAISPPHSHPHSISFSFSAPPPPHPPLLPPSLSLSFPISPSSPLRSPFSLSFSFSQHSQLLMIDQGFQGLPFPVIQQEMFMHSPQPYSHNWHVSTHCHARLHLYIYFFIFLFFSLLSTHFPCVYQFKGKVSSDIIEYLSNYQDRPRCRLLKHTTCTLPAGTLPHCFSTQT